MTDGFMIKLFHNANNFTDMFKYMEHFDLRELSFMTIVRNEHQSYPFFYMQAHDYGTCRPAAIAGVKTWNPAMQSSPCNSFDGQAGMDK